MAPLFIHRILLRYVEGGDKHKLCIVGNLCSLWVVLYQRLTAVRKGAKNAAVRTTALDDSC